MLLMCRQDVLEAATSEGSNWSKARQTGILKVNMLSLQIVMSDEKGMKSLHQDLCPMGPPNRSTRTLISQVEEAIDQQ